MPRKSHQPDDKSRRTVEAMVGYGIAHEEIARVIGIDAKTLRKYYRDEIDTGATKANARVAESLFHQACGAPAVYDSTGRKMREEQPRIPSASIWWSKARMGWKETTLQKHSGEGIAPIIVVSGVPRDDDRDS